MEEYLYTLKDQASSIKIYINKKNGKGRGVRIINGRSENEFEIENVFEFIAVAIMKGAKVIK